MVVVASQRVLARFLVFVSVLLIASCGNTEPGTLIAVGAGDSAESVVLAEIYAGALERAGARTEVVTRLGDRSEYLAALDAGRVHLVGEHTGPLLTHFNDRARDQLPKAVASAVSAALPPGLVVGDIAESADLRPRVLLPARQATHGAAVRSVRDLTARCGDSTLGVVSAPGLLPDPAVRDRIAGCEFTTTVAFSDLSALRAALLDGTVQIGLVTVLTELAPTEIDGLTVLSDEDYCVRAQNVLPLFRRGLLDHRQITKLNYVAGELTTAELTRMVVRVRDRGASPEDSARAWLDAHRL
ncbi:glycine betaine ABC transporter substrate-binding protein [Nocardia sp. CNY236]|uniref:glycine betaine ABC transporter substrate-binding protein n=1 Tax=Nocardia sp. CNY236 TaxID=1169152 RepID=UPI00041BDABB|nr:glycine betaine ABC transporter substrate-binding protein [Nocardia sp. CNY236]